jgi:hypothetical protein
MPQYEIKLWCRKFRFFQYSPLFLKIILIEVRFEDLVF